MNKQTSFFAILFLLSLVISARSHDESKSIEGVKVLVAYDPYKDKSDKRDEFKKALKENNVKIVKQYRYGMYTLIDCGMNAQSIVDSLPNHAGAIVFSDGNVANVIPSFDNRVPNETLAIKRWGSSANGMKQMREDIAKYSKMTGINSKKIDLSNGKPVFGNPFVLQLKPGKDKTMLEVFLLTEGQFDYLPAKKKQ